MGAARESSFDCSTMTYAKIYPLTDIIGMYCMSYSPSFILHFCNLLAISGFYSTCLIGWSMMTMLDVLGSTSLAVCWHVLNPILASPLVLKNSSDLSADLAKNLFRFANFPFNLCTSFRHFRDGKPRTASTLSRQNFIPLVLYLVSQEHAFFYSEGAFLRI
ncbi:hypothetical protein Tco_1532281 [Tanacetum coccineum]